MIQRTAEWNLEAFVSRGRLHLTHIGYQLSSLVFNLTQGKKRFVYSLNLFLYVRTFKIRIYFPLSLAPILVASFKTTQFIQRKGKTENICVISPYIVTTILFTRSLSQVYFLQLQSFALLLLTSFENPVKSEFSYHLQFGSFSRQLLKSHILKI